MVAPQLGVIAPDGTLKVDMGGHTSAFKVDLENNLRDVLGIERPVVMEGIAGGEEVAPERKLAMREMAKASMFIKRKMSSKAIPQVKKAVESDDTYVEAHLLLADLLLGEGETEEAKKHYTRVLELAENNSDAKVGLARVQAKEGDYEGAVALLEKAALVSPKSEMLYYYLGMMHEDAGQFEKAVGAYRKALEKMMKGH
jgi:tetratricopeptide (TPR) repeat protein